MKIKTKNFDSYLLKLETQNTILKSKSLSSFSPINLAGKLVIKINNNINNNNIINNNIDNNSHHHHHNHNHNDNHINGSNHYNDNHINGNDNHNGNPINNNDNNMNNENHTNDNNDTNTNNDDNIKNDINNIKNKNINNQRSSVNTIKTFSKIEDSESYSREMNYFELFPAETPHLCDFNEFEHKNDLSPIHKNFTNSLMAFTRYNNRKPKKNDSIIENVNFLNNSIEIEKKNENDKINENKNNEIKTKKSKFKKLDSNEILSFIKIKHVKSESKVNEENGNNTIKRKISIPNRRRVQFNIETKINLKDTCISLSKLDLKRSRNNNNKSFLTINKSNYLLNESKSLILKNSFVTFKSKNSNISSNLSTKNFPVFSKNVLIKKFYYYFVKKKPLIFPNPTKNKIVTSFCGYTYKNGMKETKTKISINVNLKDSNKNIYSFFTLHTNKIGNEEINQLYNSISKLNCKNLKYVNEVNTLFKNLNSNCLTILFKNKTFYSFFNYIEDGNQFDFKAIISNDNGYNINIIKLNNRNLKIVNNFDFILLMNRTIFDVLSNHEIVKIIYMVLKNSIINNNTYEAFLSNIIETMFKEVINKGVLLDMCIIFITFDNIKKIFDKKAITQINDALKNLGNTNFDNDINIKEIEDSPEREIKVRNNFNLTFKENKSIQSENTYKKKESIYLIENHEKGSSMKDFNCFGKNKRNKPFLCGLFC
jgi:hypothetical protein